MTRVPSIQALSFRFHVLSRPVISGDSEHRHDAQPNASCEETSSAPNGFSSGGFAKAELHYAGNGAGSLNATSTRAVSQYDVACYQVSLHH
jgi:hypothetical protein